MNSIHHLPPFPALSSHFPNASISALQKQAHRRIQTIFQHLQLQPQQQSIICHPHLSYADLICLLQQNNWDEDNIPFLQHLTAQLARRGSQDASREEIHLLEQEIAQLFSNEEIEIASIGPQPQLQAAPCKGKISKSVKNVKKFIKKHKKAILVGAALVAATGITIGTLGMGSAATVAVAIAARRQRDHALEDADNPSLEKLSSSTQATPLPVKRSSSFQNIGPTPPIEELIKRSTPPHSTVHHEHPSMFSTMSKITPGTYPGISSGICQVSPTPEQSPYFQSQESLSVVRSPQNITQPLSQQPSRVHPENRSFNTSPPLSSMTTHRLARYIPSHVRPPVRPIDEAGVGHSSTPFPMSAPDLLSPGARLPTFYPSSSNILSHQEIGQRALANRNYSQAVQAFGKAIALNPTHPLPYLERGVAHFGLGQYDQSLEDYRKYTCHKQKTYPLSIPEFSLGFAQGLPKGIYDAGSGLLFFMSDLLKNPIHTASQVWDSLTLLSKLVRSEEWSVLSETLAPEVHQLVKEWDTLPSDQRGQLAGYAFGKYGADLFIPGAVAKAVSKGVKGTQELNIVYRGLKTAEQTLLLESAAELGSGAKIGEFVHLEKQISNWLGEGTQFIRNKAGDPIFLSKDGLKKVRFDFNRAAPHESPHLHFEHLMDGEWQEISRIYPIDVPHK